MTSPSAIKTWTTITLLSIIMLLSTQIHLRLNVSGREWKTLKASGVPLVFLRDNLTLVVCAENSLQFWDAYRGVLLREVLIKDLGFPWATLSFDHSLLAIAGEHRGKGNANTVLLFNAKTGKQIGALRASGDAPIGGGQITEMSFSPDGALLAGASTDRTARVWDVRTRKLIRTCKGHYSQVLALAWSPDGQVLATGSDDQTVRLWHLDGNKSRRTLKHSDQVYDLAFLDKKTMASVCVDGTVRLWDTWSGRTVRTWRTKLPAAIDVGFSPGGEFIAAGAWAPSIGGKFEVYNVRTGRLIDELSRGSAPRSTVAISADGKLIAYAEYASPSTTTEVKVWRVDVARK